MKSEDALNILRTMYMKQVMESQFSKFAASMTESKISYYDLEHHPNIQCGISDADMLLFRIDMALDAGDADLFMQLTEELNGLEVST